MADIEVIKVEAGINVDVSREFNQVDLTNAVGRAETAAASAEADLVLTNADVVLTHADVVTSGTNATNSQLKAWESEASSLTAYSYANEAEDVPVNIVTSDGDGTFTYTPQAGVYSALHWEAKSVLATADFVLKSGDTMTGALNVPAGATGTQVAQVQEVVKKSGDTMTGALSVPSGATTTQVPQVQEVVKKSGDTMTGALSVPSSATGTQVPQVQEVVKKSGDTMIGNLEAPSITIGGNNLSTYSLKNKLINGDFRVNQGTYVSGTATTTANEYTLDRWRVVTLGEALTFSTIAGVTTITAPTNGVEQVIENINIQGGSFYLSYTGTATAIVYESSDNVTYSTVTPTAGVYTITGGYYVKIKLSAGTASNVQFEEGSVATPFEQRHIGLELSLCQRYYEVISGLSWYEYYAENNNYLRSFMYQVKKRSSPTVTPTFGTVLNGSMSLFSTFNTHATILLATTATGRAGANGVISLNIDAEL